MGEASRAAQAFTAHPGRESFPKDAAGLRLELCPCSAAVSSALCHIPLSLTLPGQRSGCGTAGAGLARGCRACPGVRGLCRATARPGTASALLPERAVCPGGSCPCPACRSRPESPRCGSSVRGQRPRVSKSRISKSRISTPRISKPLIPRPARLHPAHLPPYISPRAALPLPSRRSGCGGCAAPQGPFGGAGSCGLCPVPGGAAGSARYREGMQRGRASGAGLLGQLLGPSSGAKKSKYNNIAPSHSPKKPTNQTNQQNTLNWKVCSWRGKQTT